MFNRILASLMLIGFIGACNTIEGAGKDVSVIGDKTQSTAKDVSKEMDKK